MNFQRTCCLAVVCWLGIFLFGNTLNARIVTLTVGAGVKTNDVVAIGTNEFVTLSSAGGTGSARFFIEKNDITFTYDSYYFDPQANRYNPLSFAGPAKVTLTTFGATNVGPSFVTLEIQPDQFPPDKTVIVPDGTGANIILEASTNLVNWSPAPLGLYTNRTGNLFFRIRADRIP